MVAMADKEWIRVGKWGASMHIRAELRAPDEESDAPEEVGAVRLEMCPAFWEALNSCLDGAHTLRGRGEEPGSRVILTEPLAKGLYRALGTVLGGKTP